MPENMQNPICLSFPSAEPGTEPLPGVGAAGWWSSAWTDRWRDGGMEAACGGFTVRRGMRRGRALCPLAANQSERWEPSSLARPSMERQGGGTGAQERRNKLTKLTRLPSLLGSFGRRIPAHLSVKSSGRSSSRRVREGGMGDGRGELRGVQWVGSPCLWGRRD